MDKRPPFRFRIPLAILPLHLLWIVVPLVAPAWKIEAAVAGGVYAVALVICVAAKQRGP